MPKISEARRAERREEIMSAAVRCFARSGYHQTSMADIIAESGLSAGAIYGYFSGKQELIRAVARWLLGDRRAELETVSAQRVLTPAEIVTTLISGLSRNAPAGMVLQVWAEATVDAELREFVRELIAEMHDVVAGHLQRWAAAHPELIDGEAASWAEQSAPVLLALAPGFLVQKTVVAGFSEEAFFAAIPGIVRSAR